eukprot:3157935-Rhodomonas_salina.1
MPYCHTVLPYRTAIPYCHTALLYRTAIPYCHSACSRAGMPHTASRTGIAYGVRSTPYRASLWWYGPRGSGIAYGGTVYAESGGGRGGGDSRLSALTDGVVLAAYALIRAVRY